MIKDNSTGKDKEFYSKGKQMFDNIEVIHPKRKEPTMTDLRQAAQQALEALEGWDNHGSWVWPVSALEQSKQNTTQAITALREALEKSEQEPVAWTTMPKAADWCFVSGSKDPTNKLEGKWVPLYAAPPAAQRPWQGLTEFQFAEIYNNWNDTNGSTPWGLNQALEAKLRKLNT